MNKFNTLYKEISESIWNPGMPVISKDKKQEIYMLDEIEVVIKKQDDKEVTYSALGQDTEHKMAKDDFFKKAYKLDNK